MPHTRALVLLATLAVLSACKDDKGDSGCLDGAAEPSVQVVVTDIEAAPLTDALVQFSDNGGPAEDCDFADNTWLCGMDVTGTVEVQASAPEHIPQTETFEVESDGCHAITVSHAFRLIPN